MSEILTSARWVRFGVFQVDLHAGEIRKKGGRIRLQPQPFQLLALLLKRQGDVVTREEIRASLWPDGTFIDFDHSLGTALNKLREVLGDSASTPRFIETLPRRGYRFLVSVTVDDPPDASSTVVGGPLQNPHNDETLGIVSTNSNLLLQRRFVWFSALAVLLLCVGAAVLFNRSPTNLTRIRSIAVLPLENLSGDPSQDYFSDGMTDELITELGQLRELRVISRSSVMGYKGVHKPLPQIARELKVDAVVEGTVVRAGKQIRITAQLIDATSDHQIWARGYEDELSNTLVLQGKVARAIAEQIRVQVSTQERAALDHTPEVSMEAHEAYLKGRYFWNKRTPEDLKKATDYFAQAISIDPQYAQAYSGLADSYSLMGDWEYGVLSPKDAFLKARAAATKAVALDNTLAAAHTSLAFCLNLFDWDWDAAEAEFQRAISLNPNYATARQWYAWHLIVLGRDEEALEEIKAAGRLDPLSLIIGADTADMLLVTRRVDASIKQSQNTIAMDPYFAVAHYQLGQALAQKRVYKEAIGELQQAITLSPGNKAFIAHLAYVYARSGEKRKAAELLNALLHSADGFSSAAEIALVYVGLGDTELALDWVEKGYEERFNPTVLFRPSYDALRSESRFRALMRRIGLKQYNDVATKA